MGKSVSKTTAKGLLGASIAALAVAISTAAWAEPREFNVPAEAAVQAIPEFARQAGIQIIAPAGQLRGVQTPAVHGTMEPRAALQILLQGTGLEVASDDGRVITLRAASPTQLGAGESATSSAADEEIVVTGSRVRRRGDVLSAVTTIDRADIQDGGFDRLDTVIQGQSAVFEGGASQDVNPGTSGFGNANRNTTFASGVNLRGLGTDATLVLVNGRRIVPTAAGAVADIGIVPLSAVERIDILTDGASAIYGSEAVAGVVNIITRRNYAGAETSARYGWADGKEDYNASQLVGWGWGEGNLIVGLDYERLGSLDAGDRDYSAGAGASTNLMPDQESRRVFSSFNQDLSPNASVQLDAYYSTRDFSSSSEFLTWNIDGQAEAWSVAGGARFDISDRFALALDASYSTETDDINLTYPFGSFPSTANQSLWVFEPYASGRLLTLQTGPVQYAFGASYKLDEYEAEGLPASVADRESTAVFGEVIVPLAGPILDGGANQLELSLAGRYEQYSDFGSTTNPKVALAWMPTPGLRFVGSYSTSFKAPTLTDVNNALNSSAFLFPISDPLAPSGTTVSLLRLGANADLEPETSTSYTLSMHYDGERLAGIRGSLQYFDIEYENRITDLSFIALFTALDQEDVFADYITRSPTQTQIDAILNDPFLMFGNFAGVPPTAANVGAIVDLRFQNAASEHVQGLDFSVNRTTSTAIGDWTIDLSGTYFLEYTRRLAPRSPEQQVSGLVYNPPDFRANASLRWSNGLWSSFARANYVDSLTDDVNPACGATPCDVDSWSTLDLGIAYDTSRMESAPPGLSGVRLSLTVINATDEDPPFVNDARGFGFDSSNSSALGRFVTFAITKSW